MVGSLVNNRSPSPSSRPNRNPNNQEREGVGARKSFSGYPFVKCYQQGSFVGHTPANSPAEYSRRSSFGKEGGVQFRDNEQKENEKDPNIKPIAKTKSPSIISKGTKNFMSPTISAASKINPSPRKKVLGERNDPIRTSASLSDGKFNFFSTSSLEVGEDTDPISVMEHPRSRTMDFEKVGSDVSIMEPDKDVNFSEQFQADVLDMVVLSPEFPVNATKSPEALPISEMPKMVADKNVGLSAKDAGITSRIASLDADPSAQPYDPKTNYLSPRPQFRRYKPLPRIGSYINESISLEDDFSSKSVSDTDLSEVQSEDTQEQQEDVASSVGTMSVEENPESSSGSSTETQKVEEAAEAKSESKPRRFIKWRSVILLLLLVLGSLSVPMTYPGFGNAVYQDKIVQIYSDPYAAAELAKENLNGLLQNAKIWSVHSVVYLSQIIHNARDFDKSAPLVFSNLTDWQEEENDQMVTDFVLGPYFESVEDEPLSGMDRSSETSSQLKNYPESEDDEDSIDIQSYLTAEDSDPSADYHSETNQVEEVLSVVAAETNQVEEVLSVAADEINQMEEVLSVEANDEPQNDLLSLREQPEIQHQLEAANEPMAEAEDGDQIEIANEPLAETANKPQVETTNEPQVEAAIEALAEIDVSSADRDKSEETEMPKLPSESFVTETSEENSLPAETSETSKASISAAVSLAVVSMLAAATFMYVKRKKAPSADQLTADVKPKHVASIMEQSIRETPSSWSGPVEVDLMGESCPSEMSSFQNNSSYNKRDHRGVEDAQSRQKNAKRSYKRESIATSSDDTMTSSYGSFTTYSIIHPKHGDEEMVTPVRRSSRIKTKVTSP